MESRDWLCKIRHTPQTTRCRKPPTGSGWLHKVPDICPKKSWETSRQRLTQRMSHPPSHQNSVCDHGRLCTRPPTGSCQTAALLDDLQDWRSSQQSSCLVREAESRPTLWPLWLSSKAASTTSLSAPAVQPFCSALPLVDWTSPTDKSLSSPPSPRSG